VRGVAKVGHVIELRNVGKTFAATRAVDDVSLSIHRGEFVVLVGASGSGKSTLLKLINRMVEPDGGSILFLGQDIQTLRPEDLRRRMGYAIQSIGLFPHWNVARNIATVPQLLGWPAARIAARVDALLQLLNLEPAQYRDRYPHQLSGGQQQRVGVARALAADPEVLLMDEPFGALDPITRQALQLEMARIHQTSGKTIVLVTHDVEEALRLAMRIVLLDRGRVVQDGPPVQLLELPANNFVRDFFGRTELGLRLLALHRVGERVRPAEHAEHADHAAGEPVPASMNLRDALSQFVVRRTDRLPVTDALGQPLGVLHFSDLLLPRAP
jgi:osmoprotectant transport system ATP-binding protein